MINEREALENAIVLARTNPGEWVEGLSSYDPTDPTHGDNLSALALAHPDVRWRATERDGVPYLEVMTP
jgi:hypothetical protein